MKLLSPNASIIGLPEPTDSIGVLQLIEKIGRTCYKSEDKINDTSCIKFVESLRNRKHWAILEHYIFVLSVPESVYLNFKHFEDIALEQEDHEYITKASFIKMTEWKDAPERKYKYLMSFSATALNYLIQCSSVMHNKYNPVSILFDFMQKHIPALMYDGTGIDRRHSHEGISFLSRAEIKSLPVWLRKIHDSMTVLFSVDRGVVMEITRHRPASYACESTRYCNYCKGQFGSNINVIVPSFYEGDDDLSFKKREIWYRAMDYAEAAYNELIALGSSPQEARSVLPNSLKADIFMTARMEEWIHFFNMRADRTAHPQMREVVIPLLKDAYTIDNRLFHEVSWRLEER